MKKLVNAWLKAALLDLKNIEKIIDDEFLTPMVAFHAHQAIEKSLKAILELQQTKIQKIHKLQTLIDLAGIDMSKKMSCYSYWMNSTSTHAIQEIWGFCHMASRH